MFQQNTLLKKLVPVTPGKVILYYTRGQSPVFGFLLVLFLHQARQPGQPLPLVRREKIPILIS